MPLRLVLFIVLGLLLRLEMQLVEQAGRRATVAGACMCHEYNLPDGRHRGQHVGSCSVLWNGRRGVEAVQHRETPSPSEER